MGAASRNRLPGSVLMYWRSSSLFAKRSSSLLCTSLCMRKTRAHLRFSRRMRISHTNIANTARSAGICARFNRKRLRESASSFRRSLPSIPTSTQAVDVSAALRGEACKEIEVRVAGDLRMLDQKLCQLRVGAVDVFLVRQQRGVCLHYLSECGVIRKRESNCSRMSASSLSVGTAGATA